MRRFLQRTLCTSVWSSPLNHKSHWIKEIQRNTVVSRDHLTPGLPLHLITKDCEIYHRPHSEQTKVFPLDPFWGFYWPGGQAVSRFIEENPKVVRGKIVLDIGSGCGASAIAAVKAGAKRSIANDIDEVSCIAAELNANLNGVAIETTSQNLLTQSIDGVAAQTDVVLVGDLCYDTEFSEILFDFLVKMRSRGVEIIVGDPGRHGLTKEIVKYLEPLVKYELTETGREENHGFGVVQTYRFK